jgi:nicotinamidase-related amidase
MIAGPANKMPALIVIDLQKAIDDPQWRRYGGRNNPDAEQNVARLLEAWRARKWPIYHVRHDSQFPNSTYRPGQPGHEFKPETAPLAGETLIPKTVNSAFIGTDLEARLRAAGHTTLFIAGVITNNSVEATVRMAGNLGFAVTLVEDACFTFARTDRSGRVWSAEDVHTLSVANMEGEYCAVGTTSETLAKETGLRFP